MKGLLVLSTSLILIALTGASPSEGKVTLQTYEQLADSEDVKKKKKKGKKIIKKGSKKKKGFFSKVFGSK
tara:strand:+ start:675 stop:884 length:210 start_codon:yes stop_codon:yes gene_type:complete